MAERGGIRRLSALIPLVLLVLGFASIQGLALAQEAPPSDEQPSDQPPADEPPPSDGGEAPSGGSSGQDEAPPPSDGGEAPSGGSGGSDSGGSDGGSSPPSGGGSSSGSSGESSGYSEGGGDAAGDGERSESAASTKAKTGSGARASVKAKKATSGAKDDESLLVSAAGDLPEIVSSGEDLAGSGGGSSNERSPSDPGDAYTDTSAAGETGEDPGDPYTPDDGNGGELPLTGTAVGNALASGLALIALGMLLLNWSRVRLALVRVAVSLPVL